MNEEWMMALMRCVVVAAVLGISGTSAALGQSNDLIVPGAGSRPALESGSVASSPKVDLSEPRKALASFMKATDEGAMREAMVVEPASKGVVDAFLGVMVATIAVQKEAQAQYGPAAAPYFSKA